MAEFRTVAVERDESGEGGKVTISQGEGRISDSEHAALLAQT